MSKNLKIVIFAVVAIAVAVLIGQTPDKGPYAASKVEPIICYDTPPYMVEFVDWNFIGPLKPHQIRATKN